MDIFKADAILSNYRTLADGTLRVIFDLNEIDKESGVALFTLHKQFGNLLFGTDVTFLTTPKTKDPKELTPSQRLRLKIARYQLFMGNQDDSEAFYIKTMENIINQFEDRMK